MSDDDDSQDKPASSERIIADRYTLLNKLGGGAHGEVWVAFDRVLREKVAFKWMRYTHPKVQARVRREITTLRMLPYPGVVRFIDEGTADNRPFLVMELVVGRPFPGLGLDRRLSWQSIAKPTLALLEALTNVHAAGVVHRDLKPDNILVRFDGRAIMLDFGISQLYAFGEPRLTDQGGVVGTPLYLAPEQIHGEVVDGRADLYTIGVMLYRALTGEFAHFAESKMELYNKKLHAPARAILEVVPDVPPRIAAVVDRLLARRPEDRFASATDVLVALQGKSPGSIWPRASVAALDTAANSVHFTEHDLTRLFVGPDRLFHLREDAARVLRERTEGIPGHIEEELSQWVRLGLARRDGERYSVDRGSLEWLEVGVLGLSDERRLRKLMASGQTAEAVKEARTLAERYLIAGNLGAATRVLTEGLRVARDGGVVGEEAQILWLWTKLALAENTARALDRALYEIARAHEQSSRLKRIQLLLEATLAAPGANASRAKQIAESLLPFHDSVLERARYRIRITAAAVQLSMDSMDAVIDEIEEWAENNDDPLAELSLLESRGRQKYHEGCFEEAANLFAEASALETWTTARIEMALRSGSAFMEAFQHEKALTAAERARILAARSRNPFWEGRAEWLIRAIQYRTGQTNTPDIDLVDAVSRLGAPELEALVCLNEATVAMREGQRDVAVTLAERAGMIWRGMRRPEAIVVARAVAIACGAKAEQAEVEEMSIRALSCKGRGIGVQILGLLGPVFPGMRSTWEKSLPRLVDTIPQAHWNERMDVLSVHESLNGASGRTI